MVALACIKWRWLGKIFLVTETVQHFLLCFTPHSYINLMTPFLYMQDALIHYSCYYCGQRFALPMLLSQVSFETRFGLCYAYGRPFSAGKLLETIYFILIVFIFLACI